MCPDIRKYGRTDRRLAKCKRYPPSKTQKLSDSAYAETLVVEITWFASRLVSQTIDGDVIEHVNSFIQLQSDVITSSDKCIPCTTCPPPLLSLFCASDIIVRMRDHYVLRIAISEGNCFLSNLLRSAIVTTLN